MTRYHERQESARRIAQQREHLAINRRVFADIHVGGKIKKLMMRTEHEKAQTVNPDSGSQEGSPISEAASVDAGIPAPTEKESP